jgi:simple sugar transport system substrate-binding protein
MGNRIVELVGSGKVALFIATPGQLNIQPRIDGAIQAIEDSGAAIEYEQVETSAELPEELNRIEAWYLGNTDAVGMFAVDAGSTQGVAQVVQSQNARDQGLLGAGGYDLLPTTVELLSQGVIDFTIDQQPYLQGFLPVIYLYLRNLSGGAILPPETNTGLVFLDQAGAQLFLGTSSRFEGDSDEQKIVEPVGAPAAPATTAG